MLLFAFHFAVSQIRRLLIDTFHVLAEIVPCPLVVHILRLSVKAGGEEALSPALPPLQWRVLNLMFFCCHHPRCTNLSPPPPQGYAAVINNPSSKTIRRSYSRRRMLQACVVVIVETTTRCEMKRNKNDMLQFDDLQLTTKATDLPGRPLPGNDDRSAA